MIDTSTSDQLYELDRALLDEHGPSYIETMHNFAEGMRAEGRTSDADDAMRQCDRMRAILLSDGELLAAYGRLNGEDGEVIANAICGEIERRGFGF